MVDGKVERLREPILHEAIVDLDQMLGKMNVYPTSSARMRFDRNVRAGVLVAITHGAWTFFRTYVLRAGFLDGREGFILAVANAEGSYYRYLQAHADAGGEGAMKTAVIITTYNRPDVLQAVLEGYAAQDNDNFELLVADDGSAPPTRRPVEDFATHARFPVRHIWQEDRGFRAAAARNRALAATLADYIVFSDGDCIPPPFSSPAIEISRNLDFSCPAIAYC